MTTEQIKALAKQAGGVTWESDFGAISATFRPDALIEFVRLVREDDCKVMNQALEELMFYRNAYGDCSSTPIITDALKKALE